MAFSKFCKLLVLWLMFSSDLEAVEARSLSNPPMKTFASYRHLQSDLVDFLGEVQGDILFIAKDIQDSEIGAALFLAMYRGVRVRVLLGSGSPKRFNSRLFLLRRLRVPVMLIQEDVFRAGPPAFIVSRKRAFGVSCFLRPRSRCANPVWLHMTTEDRASWINRAKGKFSSLGGFTTTPKVSSNFDAFSTGYKYSDQRKPKPDHVPARLPRRTIWQKRQINR